MRARKAVLTAAGRGTRMFPATRAIQKELLPLVDTAGVAKPAVQLILEDCITAGIEEICIVVGKGGQGPFREHFRAFTESERPVFANKPWAMADGEHLAELAHRITYVEQDSPEGFGHAVYQARDFVGNHPFVLLLGDHLFTTTSGAPSPFTQMLDVADALGGSVTAVRVDPESYVPVTGVVKCAARNEELPADCPGQTYDIQALIEKPTAEEAKPFASPGIPDGHYLCHFGIHLFTPEIFDCLHQLISTNTRARGEYQLTSAQQLLLERSLKGDAPPYFAYYPNATRWDIGVPDGYLEALIAFAQRGPFAPHLNTMFGLTPPKE